MGITAQQLEERRGVIGSSDVGAILGMDPYKDGLAVLGSKIGGLEPDDDAGDKAEFGTRMEPVLRGWLADEIKADITEPREAFKHRTHKFLAANIDAMIDTTARGQPIAELKVSGLSDGWGEPGTDQVPDRVLAQVVHQMACSDAPYAYVVRCAAGYTWTPMLYRIERDESVIDALVSRLAAWWQDHVIDRKPIDPATITMASARRIIRTPMKEVQWGLDQAELIVKWQDQRAARLACEKAEEAALAKVLATLGDAEAAVLPGIGRFQYAKENAGKRLDKEKMRLDYPGLCAEFEGTAANYQVPATRLVPRWKAEKPAK